MVVAPRAFKRQPQERGPKRIDAIDDIRDAELFLDDTSLFVLRVEPVERRGDALRLRRIGEQVARELPRCELVERQVVVEGGDHPVAVRPRRAKAVHLIAVCVGIPRQIEPLGRHPLTVARRLEQPVDHPLIRFRRRVLHERFNLIQRRRQSGEIERDAANQPFFACFRCERLQPTFFNRTQHKPVNAVHDARLILGTDARWLDTLHRCEGPMAFVLASLLDPLFEQRLLGGGQLLRVLGRRHRFIGISRTNASHEFTLRDIARHDGSMSVVNGPRTFGRVESQIGLPRLLVRAVTGPALVREDRTNIAIETNLARSRVGRDGFDSERDCR